jgi:hypothetical protein
MSMSFVAKLIAKIEFLEEKICRENNLRREELWTYLLYHSK